MKIQISIQRKSKNSRNGFRIFANLNLT